MRLSREPRTRGIAVLDEEGSPNMKTLRFTAYMTVFIAITVFAPRLARAEQAATIIKVDGTVKVQRAGKEKSVKGKFPLAWGDKIVVVSGSARVVFNGCKPMTITADLDITKANAPKDCGGAAVRVKNSNKKTRDLKTAGSGGATIRNYNPGQDVFFEFSAPIVTILSVNGATAAARPVFRWRVTTMDEIGNIAAVSPDKTLARLLDENGGVLWSTSTVGTIVAYPETLDPLTGGKGYTFEVDITIRDQSAQTAITSFRVLTEAEISEISSVAAAIKTEYADQEDILLRHNLLALYYKQNEMYTEAIAELQDLIALDPYDIDSYYELADIYDNTGNNAARNTCIDKAMAIELDLGISDMPWVDEVSAAQQ